MYFIMSKLFIHTPSLFYVNIIFTAGFNLVHSYTSLCSFATIYVLNQFLFNKINKINYDFKNKGFILKHI